MNTKVKTDNELIAEFMGLPLTKQIAKFTGGYEDVPFQRWKYDTSWDWLMPVVQKIAEYRLAYPKETAWVCDCKIVVYQSALYREVVNFIKWYNKQNNE